MVNITDDNFIEFLNNFVYKLKINIFNKRLEDFYHITEIKSKLFKTNKNINNDFKGYFIKSLSKYSFIQQKYIQFEINIDKEFLNNNKILLLGKIIQLFYAILNRNETIDQTDKILVDFLTKRTKTIEEDNTIDILLTFYDLLIDIFKDANISDDIKKNIVVLIVRDDLNEKSLKVIISSINNNENIKDKFKKLCNMIVDNNGDDDKDNNEEEVSTLTGLEPAVARVENRDDEEEDEEEEI